MAAVVWSLSGLQATEHRIAQEGLYKCRNGFICRTMPDDSTTTRGEDEKAATLRPRPGISRDTAFFWEGITQGELRIQRCQSCERLFHPPVVRCPDCGIYDLGYLVSEGKGTIYSYVEPCHPKLPCFDYPYVVGLVELTEGTRLLTNIVDVAPNQVSVGMPVELVIRQTDPELALPMFRPAPGLQGRN